MTQQPTYGPHNPHPLSQRPTELVWEGKYDEYGDRWEADPVSGEIPVQKIYDRLGMTPPQLMEFCQKWQIAELAVFGSILRDDFRDDGDDPSDIDLLYSFSESSSHSLFDVIEIQEELEHFCHKKIDFISKKGIERSRNWLRRREILNSGMILYVQRDGWFKGCSCT